eukprot:3090323-Rhodomonas_salina.1
MGPLPFFLGDAPSLASRKTETSWNSYRSTSSSTLMMIMISYIMMIRLPVSDMSILFCSLSSFCELGKLSLRLSLSLGAWLRLCRTTVTVVTVTAGYGHG